MLIYQRLYYVALNSGNENHLHFGTVWNSQLSISCRQRDLPTSVFASVHWGSVSVPLIFRQVPMSCEFSNEIEGNSLLKSPMRYARKALGAHSRYVMSPLSWTTKPNILLPLLNFSKPPSVSSIAFIHFSALLYLRRRASLKGSSHGSSLMTPCKSQLEYFEALTSTYLCHLGGCPYSRQKSSCAGRCGRASACVGKASSDPRDQKGCKSFRPMNMGKSVFQFNVMDVQILLLNQSLASLMGKSVIL